MDGEEMYAIFREEQTLLSVGGMPEWSELSEGQQAVWVSFANRVTMELI